jgi:hypothetical protein
VRRFRALVTVMLVLPLVAWQHGCAKKQDQSQPPAPAASPPADQGSPASPGATHRENGTPHARSEGVLLRDVLASWESGKKEQAVAQLLSVRWDQPGVFSDVPTMNLSEQGFAALPPDLRNRTASDATQLTATLRSLAREALSVGEQAQVSGDKQTARVHFEAVLHLGQALSSPERLLLIQLVGKVFVKTAEERLSALK